MFPTCRLLVAFSVIGLATADTHENFCRPLEDYGPRIDKMEERQVCQTNFVKNCEPVTVADCMQVTELRCEVNLFTNCTMDWTMKDQVESLMSVKEAPLKNCTKEMVIEYHNKTIYDCKNVTKRHCTTLWTVNEQGEKIWAGNEDDCRDVTWEECNPVEKQVPMAVAQMNCVDEPVSYFDYENTTTPKMADTMDCTVEMRPVCQPITQKKCAEITYTKCEEVPETECSVLEIPVPTQNKLHKQWCLFDDLEQIDFDQEVRKIAGAAADHEDFNEDEDETVGNSVTERKAKELSEDYAEFYQSFDGLDKTSETDKTFDNEDFLSELTLLDVQSPVKRQLDPIFSDFSMDQVQTLARGGRHSSGHKERKKGKRRGGANKKKQNKVTSSNSKVQVEKEISRH